MNNITKFSAIGTPALIGLGIALIFRQIIKNEKELKYCESELKLRLKN